MMKFKQIINCLFKEKSLDTNAELQKERKNIRIYSVNKEKNESSEVKVEINKVDILNNSNVNLSSYNSNESGGSSGNIDQECNSSKIDENKNYSYVDMDRGKIINSQLNCESNVIGLHHDANKLLVTSEEKLKQLEVDIENKEMSSKELRNIPNSSIEKPIIGILKNNSPRRVSEREKVEKKVIINDKNNVVYNYENSVINNIETCEKKIKNIDMNDLEKFIKKFNRIDNITYISNLSSSKQKTYTHIIEAINVISIYPFIIENLNINLKKSKLFDFKSTFYHTNYFDNFFNKIQVNEKFNIIDVMTCISSGFYLINEITNKYNNINTYFIRSFLGNIIDSYICIKTDFTCKDYDDLQKIFENIDYLLNINYKNIKFIIYYYENFPEYNKFCERVDINRADSNSIKIYRFNKTKNLLFYHLCKKVEVNNNFILKQVVF